jgi:protein-S-isoprenylcysteine O-methyltransferase Ste14
MITKWIILGFFSIAILLMFRKELFAFRRHGPYMFVAAEGLLVLFILNGGSMFGGLLTAKQVISWILMLLSASLALFGFYGLKKHGKAVQNWENTTRLVREGVFRYIRHPLYTSLMLLAVGVLFKDVSLQAAAVCIFTLGFLVAASRVEEGENTSKFGAEYKGYALQTKRYLPFII